MAWIQLPDQKTATGEVAAYFQAVAKLFGDTSVSEIRGVFGLRPDIVSAFEVFSRQILTGGALSAFERELIATMSAAAGKCTYCTVAHGEQLCQLSDNYVDIVKLLDNYHLAGLTLRHEAMTEYAEKLTLTPDQVAEEDVVKLRDAGLTDQEIFDLVLAIAYRNFISRVADGIGAALPEKFLASSAANPERVAGYTVGKDLLK